MLGLETWSFDAGTILAAHMGNVGLDAHQILLSLTK